MPRPISRRILIRKLKRLGFIGPYSGGKHQFMELGDLRLTIPNPHQGNIGAKLLSIILKQTGISSAEFERL